LTKVSGAPAPWEPLPELNHGEVESEEPSQEQFERCRKIVSDWWSEFTKSAFYRHLSADHQDRGLNIVTAFSDFMYNYTGYMPPKWTDSGLYEVVTDIMPRKITADEPFFSAIAPVLT
jgi:hypothetical protein